MSLSHIHFSSKTHSTLLNHTDWKVRENSSWAILDGKDHQREEFFSWLQHASHSRRHEDDAGDPTPEILLCSVVNFKSEQDLILEEKRNDDSEFIEGGFDKGTLVREYLSLNDHHRTNTTSSGDQKLWTPLISIFGLTKLADTGLRFLSNGEIKKALIVKALQEQPDLLILENPFDGLDLDSRQQLSQTLQAASNQFTLILFLSQRKDLPHWIDHVLHLTDSGESQVFTPKEWALETSKKKPIQKVSAMEHLVSASNQNGDHEALVELNNINISFSGRPLFQDFSWTIKLGEHWRLCGPNGTGKTTLLQIIHADLPQSYGQNIRLFGHQRGQGESIWDIRQHIGFLGTDSQRQFPKDMTGLAAVCSGLHHTTGIYKKPSPTEIQQSRQWIQHFELEHLSKKILSEMSYAETRMILILRAMIHCPRLLILDEPCQGLKEQQQAQIFSFIDQLLQKTSTQLLCVTHDTHDELGSITHQILLQPDSNGISRAKMTTS